MAEIVRSRKIRPSSRLEKSNRYKIDTKGISSHDKLIVNIDHETKDFQRIYKFQCKELVHKKSISFRVKESGSIIELTWSGIQPIEISKNIQKKIIGYPPVKVHKKVLAKNANDPKKSFLPISNLNTNILILGTMPGDKSLELNEYYGHPRNKFWKIISTLTNNDIPLTYLDKKNLLLKEKIGIWDVARKANRKGSLDIAIKNEMPNDLNNFISTHKNLKVIGFNGAKAEALFKKHFQKQTGIKYISLPSSSPANTGISLGNICQIWQQLFR